MRRRKRAPAPAQNSPRMEIVLVILVIAAAIAAAVFAHIAAGKRRQALLELSVRLGLEFSAARNKVLPVRYGFLGRLGQGQNRYAFNVLSGDYHGERVVAFDYHYETHSRDSKGHRRTEHHYFSCLILELPIDCPELIITRETLLSKVAQALGYDDIDFESAEFSRTFCVRSKNKRFAYDICNAQMMEYLLANRDLHIELEDTALALLFPRCIPPIEIARNLDRLLEIRARIPEYLFTRT